LHVLIELLTMFVNKLVFSVHAELLGQHKTVNKGYKRQNDCNELGTTHLLHTVRKNIIQVLKIPKG
jgi:hypothetical protein